MLPEGREAVKDGGRRIATFVIERYLDPARRARQQKPMSRLSRAGFLKGSLAGLGGLRLDGCDAAEPSSADHGRAAGHGEVGAEAASGGSRANVGGASGGQASGGASPDGGSLATGGAPGSGGVPAAGTTGSGGASGGGSSSGGAPTATTTCETTVGYFEGHTHVVKVTWAQPGPHLHEVRIECGPLPG